ncbi:hypothetical protein PTKIN_Ptkin08bG0002500 [Pterospermum kingtungense]
MIDIVPKDLKEIEVAKEKISGGDYLGARKMLLEVKRNFPAVDNISGMIAVCDILFSSCLGFMDVDFYFVLQIPPEATSSEIRTRYNNFTTLLEPISNNFPGAESALKIVQEVFSVLLHREKRKMFDIKRARKLESYVSSISNRENVIDPRLAAEVSTQRHEDSLSSKSWRMGSCKVGDGDRNIYESNSMEIPSKTITDAEISNYLGERQVHDSKLTTQPVLLKAQFIGEQNKEIYDQEGSQVSACALSRTYSMARKPHDNESLSMCLSDPSKESSCSKNCNQDYHNFDDTRKAEVLSVGQVWATYDEEGMPRRYAQISCIGALPFRLHVNWFKPVTITAHERKWYEVKMPVVCGLFNLDGNEGTVIAPTLFSHLISRHASEVIEIYPQSGEVWAIYKDWKPLEWLANPRGREECTLEIVEVINGYFNYADVVVKRLVKVQGFKNVFRRCTSNESDLSFAIPAKSLYRFSHRIPAYRFDDQEMDRMSDGMFELDHLAVPSRNSCDPTFTLNHDIPLPELSDAEAKSLKHKWSIKDFSPQQIWAIYHGQDWMPQRYVVVNNVISWSKVCATLLEPFPVLDEEISWVEDNLPFACGLFICGETTLNLDLCRFSHAVKCEKIMEESLYKICPKKGEVWAMYKNRDGTRKHADFDSHQYQIVEVVTDFCEESGLIAVSLVEVPGWKSFFKRQLQNGYELSQTITRKEMVRFCHQVPAYTVEGIESRGIPRGSWHLEPDALPPKLGTTSLESRC